MEQAWALGPLPVEPGRASWFFALGQALLRGGDNGVDGSPCSAGGNWFPSTLQANSGDLGHRLGG